MKKIMQINITCGVGSTGTIASELYEASVDAGFEARFAYSVYKPTLKSAFRIESRFQNYLRRALNKFFGVQQRHSDAGTKRLIRYIKKEKPDLIHLHNVQQNSVDYKLFFGFLKTADIPIIFTLHDCWAFTGGCYHFTKVKCEKYTTGCNNCLFKKPFDDLKRTTEESYLIKKELIGGNDNIRVVCVSKWLKICATESYMGRMKYLPITIYNGINTDVFYPREVLSLKDKYNLKDEFVILGVASFWDNRKNLKLFYEIADIMPNARVILVGRCFGATDTNNGKIIFAGSIADKQLLAEYYSLADVYINASIEETFGMTTAEALACGTPAIVFNSSACPEVVDEKTGLVIDYEMDELVKAVNTIKTNGKKSYSEACVDRITELFSDKTMQEKYIDLYKKVLL